MLFYSISVILLFLSIIVEVSVLVFKCSSSCLGYHPMFSKITSQNLFQKKSTASSWYLWHILCLIQIGYIRYSSGTRLNTVNDIQVSTYALQFQKKTTRNLVLLESCSQMKLPAVVYSTFCICPLMVVSKAHLQYENRK